MRVQFYRALDRPMSIIGLKGGWIKRFLIYAGCALLLGVFIGSAMGSGVGIAVAIIGAFASFFWCLVKQEKISARRLGKEPLKTSMNVLVRRRETLSRILLQPKEVTEDNKNS